MAEQFFVFFSSMLDRPVIDSHGKAVGKLYDLSMSFNNDAYPRAGALVIQQGLFSKRYAEVSFRDVVRIKRTVHLTVPAENIAFKDSVITSEFMLRRDVLDQQVVDIEHKNVVRVNDVHLLKIDNQYHLAHVDVGLRALIRRLDWEALVDFIVRMVKPSAAYLSDDELVSWRNAQVLMLGSKRNVLKLDVARAKLAKIPPTALAEIMSELDVFEQVSLFRSLSPEIQQQVFADMAPDDRDGLVEQFDDNEAAQLIMRIPSDEATDFLMSLPKERMHHLLRLMESKTSKRLRMLLGFRKDSAGGLMGTEYLSLHKNATALDAMNKVKANVDLPGSPTTIYVVDDQGKYIATTTIRRFINEPDEKPILETCYPQKVFVRTDDGMEEIALLLEQYKYFAIPVLDENDILVGSITVDDVMEELIALTWGKYKDQL